jgi:hypothetical protein
MSNDNQNSDPFDFEFEDFNVEEPLQAGKSQQSTGESSFDLDNPFGDDVVVSRDNKSSFESNDPDGIDLSAFDSGISADNPYFQDSTTESSTEDSSVEYDSTDTSDMPGGGAKADAKKKGFGGWFAKGKDKPAKEKKEKPLKEAKPKKEKVVKEKVVKEKKPAGEAVPRDWETILCIAFSVFLLVSLLMLNLGAFLTSKNIMQTLCWLGAFNVIGLAAASVPILFYKFPKERTLPNIMLGISAVAMFSGLLLLLTEFYSYSFIMKP